MTAPVRAAPSSAERATGRPERRSTCRASSRRAGSSRRAPPRSGGRGRGRARCPGPAIRARAGPGRSARRRGPAPRRDPPPVVGDRHDDRRRGRGGARGSRSGRPARRTSRCSGRGWRGPGGRGGVHVDRRAGPAVERDRSARRAARAARRRTPGAGPSRSTGARSQDQRSLSSRLTSMISSTSAASRSSGIDDPLEVAPGGGASRSEVEQALGVAVMRASGVRSSCETAATKLVLSVVERAAARAGRAGPRPPRRPAGHRAIARRDRDRRTVALATVCSRTTIGRRPRGPPRRGSATRTQPPRSAASRPAPEEGLAAVTRSPRAAAAPDEPAPRHR